MSVDVIYSRATGRVRRIINPSSPIAIHSGELRLVVSTIQYQSFKGLSDIQSFVTMATGKTPSDDRYVAIDASYNVLSVHIADPTCGDIALQSRASLAIHSSANVHDLLWGRNNALPNRPLSNQISVLHRNQPLP